MRYYVYISDSKVDMVAAQVPPKLRKRIAAELKVDLKLFSVTLREAPTEANRFSKVDLVARYLHDEGLVGDIDSGAAYFAGTMPMHWGPWVHHEYGSDDTDVPMVWFAGETDRSALGLAGSMRHLIGGNERSVPEDTAYPTFTSFSNRAAVLDVLAADASGADPEALDSEDVMSAVAQVADRAARAGRSTGVAPENLEFLARRLFSEIDQDGRRVTLGSPIYVASAD